jgi:hypothetical protein
MLDIRTKEHWTEEQQSVGHRGLKIGKYPPPPGGEITPDFIWGKKYEKVKRKRGKM